MRRPFPLLPLLLALAGACWTAGQAVLPDMGVTEAERLAAVAADRPAQALSAALFVLAGALLTAGAVVGARRSPSGRGRRTVLAGLVLLAFGGVWLAAGRGAFNLLMYRLTDPAVDPTAAPEVLTADLGPGFLALLPALPALLLAPVVLAVGALRAGARASAWAGALGWLAGLAAFVTSEFAVKVVEAAGVGLASVGLVLVGTALAGLRASAPTPERSPAAVSS